MDRCTVSLRPILASYQPFGEGTVCFQGPVTLRVVTPAVIDVHLLFRCLVNAPTTRQRRDLWNTCFYLSFRLGRTPEACHIRNALTLATKQSSPRSTTAHMCRHDVNRPGISRVYKQNKKTRLVDKCATEMSWSHGIEADGGLCFCTTPTFAGRLVTRLCSRGL
ncbi:hypothetical protein K491DRAFT_265857 [Lophiostoma macrostomum CBS 122681]|uniref:Uncharacterized protein n=1 Tax=Lophiostoma macrostomum CBS 122681 TaxID=1314788 RepID=A0A6A6TI95_9PLEO|nr:hypothetical protein K491DRAFT_265857 [Lophiostoma macrostomum CBS 122681]